MINTRLFSFQDEKSSKFWEVTQSDATVVVRYGKTGAAGQKQEKVFPNAGAATQHVQKLIAEKTVKGYSEFLTGSTENGVNATQTTAADAVASTNERAKKQGVVKAIKTAKIINPLKNPETTPERLMALMDQDDATNRLLAKHPRASEALLEKLSHSSDKATRQAVTANPNTPPEVYVRLGQQFPNEFLANPALDLLLLMNPALMEEVPEALLVRLLSQESCPTSLLIWASAKPSKKVQLAVAMNPRTPADAVNKLKESRHAEVIKGLPNSQKTVGAVESEDIFQQELRNRLGSLSISEATEAWKKKDIGLAQYHLLPVLVQQAIAGADFLPVLSGGNIPKDMLETLSKSQDLDILAAVAENPYTSTFALERIGHDAKEWERVSPLAQNKNTPTSTLLKLVNMSSVIKCMVVRNPGLPSSEHEFFANDADDYVRCAYASNPKLSPARLEVLAESQDPWICIGVALNSNTNRQTLKEFSKDKKYWEYLVKNPSTDSEIVALIANDPPLNSLRIIAAHPNADSVVLEKIIKLRKFPESDIAIQNKNISQVNLHTLFNQGNYELVASNHSAPAHMLDLIEKNKKNSAHWLLAKNPNSSDKLLSKLSLSKDESVRGGVASNNACLPSLLEFLSHDQSAYVRWRVLANPNATENIRKSLSHSLMAEVDLSLNHWFIHQMKLASMEVNLASKNGDIFCYPGKDPNRRALSSHAIGKIMALCSGPHVAPERLARLSVSTDWLIRAAVARNTATPSNILNKIIKDAHPVVVALAKNNSELDSIYRNYTPFPRMEPIKKYITLPQNNLVKRSPWAQDQIMEMGGNDADNSKETIYLDGIVVGCTVSHAKFGHGVVLERSGEGEYDRVKVLFSNGKEKLLAILYAKLTLINS